MILIFFSKKCLQNALIISRLFTDFCGRILQIFYIYVFVGRDHYSTIFLFKHLKSREFLDAYEAGITEYSLLYILFNLFTNHLQPLKPQRMIF